MVTDFYIVDPEEACINPAKMIMGMIYLLLSNNAERKKKYWPKRIFDILPGKNILKILTGLCRIRTLVTYKGDGSIVIFG